MDANISNVIIESTLKRFRFELVITAETALCYLCYNPALLLTLIHYLDEKEHLYIIQFFTLVLILFFVFFLISRVTDKTPKEYAVYRSPLLFWGLVDLVYDMFRVNVHYFKIF